MYRFIMYYIYKWIREELAAWEGSYFIWIFFLNNVFY